MRGYGIPQAMFAVESHTDDVARALGISPLEIRRKCLMPVGFQDAFSKNVNYFDSFNQCIEKAKKYMDYDNRIKELANQTGNIRTGLGMAVFWYNTGVWPIALESSSSRMVINQDGSIQLQLGETEIGQGADTAFAQMAADSIGIPFEKVHVMSVQDTDITPFGTDAYASRQTFMASFSIEKTAKALREKILSHAYELKGIFSHESSLYLHKLSDENPSFFTLTIPSGWNSQLLKDKYKLFYLKNELWELGQEKIKTPYGNEVLVYSKERTLAEMVSKIDKLDRDLVLKALRYGLRNNLLDCVKLLEYADKFKSRTIMRTYLEVINDIYKV